MAERRIRWTLEMVVAELQKLHASGVTLTYAVMRAAGHGPTRDPRDHDAARARRLSHPRPTVRVARRRG